MGCARFVKGLSLFLQVGVAAAVVGITLAQLANFTLEASLTEPIRQTCLLGPISTLPEQSGCTTVYIVAGVSVGATILLGMFMCMTCDCCGLGPFLDLAFSAAGAVWWAITGWLLYQTQVNQNSQTPPVPKEEWRMIVVYLFWAAAGLFVICFLAAAAELVSAAKSCCCCCQGGGGSSSRRTRHDVEHGPPVPVTAYPSYAVPASYTGRPPKQQQFIYG